MTARTLWQKLRDAYPGDPVGMQLEAARKLYRAHHVTAGRVPVAFDNLPAADRHKWFTRAGRMLEGAFRERSA